VPHEHLLANLDEALTIIEERRIDYNTRPAAHEPGEQVRAS
jgi:hypothetical protein